MAAHKLRLQRNAHIQKAAPGGRLLPAVSDALRERRLEPRLHLPHDAADGMLVWMEAAALAVHRGLRPASLAALGFLERAGLCCVNPVAAVRLVEDRARLVERLASAGLPVPRTERVSTWAEAADRAQAGAGVVKRVDGRIGRGTGIATIRPDDPRREPPFPGPYIIQEGLETDGIDRKLFVAGTEIRGLLKRWPRRDPSSSRSFDPEPGLAGLASAVGSELGLSIFGLDVVLGVGRPKIVDVNAFPSFENVPGAASLIAGHIAGLAFPAIGRRACNPAAPRCGRPR
jgi:ribosomal protein S6--L-glutamate ligase